MPKLGKRVQAEFNNKVDITSRLYNGESYVELGFHKDDEINVEEMRNKVLEDLLRANIISENMTLIDHECIIMNPAYVHINTSSQEYVKAIKEQLSKKSVYSIGRYGSWTYCSIEDNVKEAKELSHYISQQ